MEKHCIQNTLRKIKAERARLEIERDKLPKLEDKITKRMFRVV